MSRLELTLDVETVPTQMVTFKNEISVECPGNYTKAETIAKWETEKKPGLIDKAYRDTALNSTKGELIVIGWAINDEPPQHVFRNLDESEGDLLQAFYSSVAQRIEGGYHGRVLWIGHDILRFDLPYLFHRSIVNSVRPPFDVPYNAKPWDERIFDTRHAWKAGSNASSSLLDICRAVGIPVKQDMHGSEVWDYVQRGEVEKVANYCSNGDVAATRALYHALQ